MSVNLVDKTTGDLTTIAGETLWADSPIGTILPYGGTSAPSGWFLCQGQALSRTTYSELFAVIGTSFGSGNGSTTFNLPDMRESVPKGAGLTGKTVGAHLDADGLAVGEFLDDRVQNHTHTFGKADAQVGLSDYSAYYKGVALSNGNGTKYNTNSNTDRKGNTTEVKSVGVNYIIKAKMCAMPSDFMSKVDEAVEEALGSDWNTITDVSAPTYFASVNLKYKKIGNILFVHGKATFNAVTIPSDSYDVLIATLPSGYRPKSAIRSITNIENGFSIISPQLQIEFSTNGKLLVYTSENIALGTSGKPISFQFVVES